MKKKIFKITVWAALAVLCAAIGLYLFLTSSFFLAGIFLPQLGRHAGCELKAQTIRLSLWNSTLEVAGARLGAADKPFATAETLKGSFVLSAIMNGDIKLNNVVLNNATVNLVRKSSGGLELPFSGQEEPAGKAPATVSATKSSAETPIMLDLANIKINNLNLTLSEEKKQGAGPARLLLAGVNVDIPRLKTGADAKIHLAGNIGIVSGNNLNVSSGKVASDIELTLNKDFLCDKLQLRLGITELQGRVNNISLAGNSLEAQLDAAAGTDNININRLTVRQAKNGKPVTDLQIKSAIAFNPLKVSCSIKIDQASEELISVLCDLFANCNPGSAGLAYSGQFDYAGGIFSSKGELVLRRCGSAALMGKFYELPAFGFAMSHDFVADLNRQEARLNRLSASLLEKKRNVLNLKLTKPATYCWNGNGREFNGAPPEISLRLNELDLKLLQLLLPPDSGIKILDGKLSADLEATATAKADAITVAHRIAVSNLCLDLPALQLRQLGFAQNAKLHIENFAKFKLGQFSLALRQNDKKLAGLNLNGMFDLNSRQASATFQLSDLSVNTVNGLPLDAELRQTIAANLNQLAPTTADIAGRLTLDCQQMSAQLADFALSVFQSSRRAASLRLEPATVNLKDIATFLNRPPTAHLELYTLPLPQFNRFMTAAGCAFNAGELSAKLKINFEDNFKQMTVEGGSTLNNADLALAGKRYRNLTLVQELNIHTVNYKQIQIARHAAEILVNRQPAMSIAGHGSINLEQGRLALNANLASLNQHLLNLFYPSEIAALKLAGKMQLELSDRFQSMQISGNMELAQLRSRLLAHPVSGSTTFKFRHQDGRLDLRQVNLELQSNGKTAVRAALTGQLRGEQTTLNLSSEKIDAMLLHKLCTVQEHNSKPQTSPPRPGKKSPATFNFGKTETIVNLDLKGISYGPTIQAAASGKLIAVANQFEAAPLNLVINGSPVNLRARLVSAPAGISYRLAGDVRELDIQPLLQPFAADELRELKLIVEALDLEIKGNGIETPQLWDNMNGQANLALRDISIPNSFGQTTIGRILIIPFEALSKFQTLNLKSDSGQKTSPAFAFVNNFYRSSETIRLNSGKVELLAQDRRLYLRQGDFKGDLISDLNMKGHAGLGADRSLDLKSTLTVSQLVAPVHITGTVDNPQYNLDEAIAAFIKGNALNLLSVGTELLKDSGKELENALNKTINIIRPGDKSGSPPPDNVKTIKEGAQKLLNSLFNE